MSKSPTSNPPLRFDTRYSVRKLQASSRSGETTPNFAPWTIYGAKNYKINLKSSHEKFPPRAFLIVLICVRSVAMWMEERERQRLLEDRRRAWRHALGACREQVCVGGLPLPFFKRPSSGKPSELRFRSPSMGLSASTPGRRNSFNFTNHHKHEDRTTSGDRWESPPVGAE